MPDWLITVISLVGSTIISTVVGVLVKRALNKGFKDQQELNELREERHRAERKAELSADMAKQLGPIEDKIDSIKADLEEDKKATIASLRSNMKQLRDKYKDQGYADAGDKATWNELYDDYKRMGGNHFKEYVDQWKMEVNNLPLEKPKQRKKANENKTKKK